MLKKHVKKLPENLKRPGKLNIKKREKDNLVLSKIDKKYYNNGQINPVAVAPQKRYQKIIFFFDGEYITTFVGMCSIQRFC